MLAIEEGIETHCDAFRFFLLLTGVAGVGIGSVAGISLRAIGGDEGVSAAATLVFCWLGASLRGVGVFNTLACDVCPFQGCNGDRVIVRGEAHAFTGVCNNLR